MALQATRMLGLLSLTLFVQGGAKAVSWPSRGQVEGPLQTPPAPQPGLRGRSLAPKVLSWPGEAEGRARP